ncbi:tetratricopeptide repeat protein [Catellatospora vulcania]|uniref:tetratricopeptide repeat protein n=1 Tax=Catellatospora vulcania TaxID=1460450 RepID=UPI0012D3E812|nr:tetratricopeptide repeat protein [Catellatospora vulcania]
MPSGADLFELFFMGPGLLCLPFALLLPVTAFLRRRNRRRVASIGDRAEELIDSGQVDAGLALLTHEADRLRRGRRSQGRVTALISLLIQHCNEALTVGRTDAARAAAAEAVELSATLYPTGMPRAHALFALGRTLARLGDDDAACRHLQQSVVIADADGSDPHGRVLFAANASMVLRRVGDTPAALAMATRAVHLELSTPPAPQPFVQAGRGWTHAALALAQTDSGLDGRAAARTALETFRRLDQEKIIVDGEGIALTCYIAAYAGHRQGDGQALDLARESVDRFSKLAGPGDALHQRRRADAERLLAEITSDRAVTPVEDLR